MQRMQTPQEGKEDEVGVTSSRFKYKTPSQLFEKILKLAEQGLFETLNDEHDEEANQDDEAEDQDEEIVNEELEEEAEEDRDEGVWVQWQGKKLLVPLGKVDFKHPLQVSRDPFTLPEELPPTTVGECPSSSTTKSNNVMRKGKIQQRREELVRNTTTTTTTNTTKSDMVEGYVFSSKRGMPSLVPDTSAQPSRRKNERQVDFLTSLPPELSWQVLSYFDLAQLSELMLVAKSWRELALNPRLWSHLSLWDYKGITDNKLDMLVRRAGPWLRSLELPKHHAVGRPDTLVFMATHCRRMETLDISLTGRELKYLAKNFNVLQHMEFIGSLDMTSTDIIEVASLVPSVSSITLWEVSLTDHEMHQFAKNFRALESIVIFEYNAQSTKKKGYTSEGEEENSNSDEEEIEEHEDNSKAKDRNHHNTFSTNGDGIDDDSLQILVEAHAKTLKSITLNGMKNITGTSIVTIANTCRKLKSLSILDCPRLNTWLPREKKLPFWESLEELILELNEEACERMLVLAKKAPNLRSLCLGSKVNESALYRSIEECKALEMLELAPSKKAYLSREYKLRILEACPLVTISFAEL